MSCCLMDTVSFLLNFYSFVFSERYTDRHTEIPEDCSTLAYCRADD